MKIGFVGLGKMGGNMVRRLLNDGHEVVVWNRSQAPLKKIAGEGASTADSLEDLTRQLTQPRIIWLMVAPTAVDPILFGENGLGGFLDAGDIVIDGGNSNFRESLRHAELLGEGGIDFLDAGCSGGPAGAANGLSITIGGERHVYESTEPIFKTLAVENGYTYSGPSGAGHYAKMVHNAIEYGILQAFGEGYELLKASPYNFDLQDITEVWRHGSVIRSFLLDLVQQVVDEDQDLSQIEGRVAETGEARWAVREAIEARVPFTSIANSLFTRYRSQQDDSYGAKLIAALRGQFGAHQITRKEAA